MATNISLPKVSLSLVGAKADVQNAPQKVLIIGQKHASGIAASGSLYTIGNQKDEDVLFYPASHIAQVIKAFKEIGPNVQLDAIGLTDDAGGTAARYTITLSGTATEQGTIRVYIGSYKKSFALVSVLSGDTANAVGIKLAAAITGMNTFFSATNSSGVVTVTCLNKGTVGNNIPIGVELKGAVSGAVAGLTFAVAQTITGATDPTALNTSAVFDVIGQTRYQAIIWAYPNSAIFSVPVGFLDARFNVNNKILDGVCFGSICDTYANCITAVDSFNSKNFVLFADKKLALSNYVGPVCREYGPFVNAEFAAIRAVRLTKGEAISQYVVTKASSDQYGGTALASLPYYNTTIPRIGVSFPGQGWIDSEIDGLATEGAAIVGQNIQGTNSLVGEVPTTYKTDAVGSADISWKYLNYVDTMSAAREYFFNNYKAAFAQSRLTNGNAQRGRDMVNRSRFEAFTDKLFGDLSGPDFVLCQAGEDALKFFKRNRFVTLDLATGTVTVDMQLPIVTQLRQIIGTVKIAFSLEG